MTREGSPRHVTSRHVAPHQHPRHHQHPRLAPAPQLEPVTCKTTKEALELRATQMTDNQKQIREDCTRFRYGDEQHLEEALNRIFKPNRPGGVARKLIPVLTGGCALAMRRMGPLLWHACT